MTNLIKYATYGIFTTVAGAITFGGPTLIILAAARDAMIGKFWGEYPLLHWGGMVLGVLAVVLIGWMLLVSGLYIIKILFRDVIEGWPE